MDHVEKRILNKKVEHKDKLTTKIKCDPHGLDAEHRDYQNDKQLNDAEVTRNLLGHYKEEIRALRKKVSDLEGYLEAETESRAEADRQYAKLEATYQKYTDGKDNNHINETAMNHELMEMDLLTENQALKDRINDLEGNLETEREARAETDRHHAELVAIYRSTIDWCEKERSAHLEHIQLLEKQIEDNKTNSLQERLEALEKLAITLESRKLEWSGTRVQNREVDDRDSSEKCSENVTLDPPTVNDDCQESSAAEPSSSNKSEGSVVIKLGLNMLLSGQRQMNLEGIMWLYTEFHAKEDFDDADDGWKKYFVEVVTCELDGKLDNVSAVAQRLMNNVHIKQFQDPVEGVHVEKSQFDKEELKCLELICDALCIDFKAS